jgi:hypothetical protein
MEVICGSNGSSASRDGVGKQAGSFGAAMVAEISASVGDILDIEGWVCSSKVHLFESIRSSLCWR